MTQEMKVAELQELKETCKGRIEVPTMDYAQAEVDRTLGYTSKNENASANAGYDIYANEEGDSVSYLGDRVEINLASGKTFNIWIIGEVAYQAKTYDLLMCDFFHKSAIDEGDNEGAEFWQSVIEYKLKDDKNADVWKKFCEIEKIKSAQVTDSENYLATYKTATKNIAKVQVDFQVNNESEDTASEVEIARFEVGRTYYAHSSCDYGTIFSYTVISRTAKMATLENQFGEVSKRKIKIDKDGEYILPEGSYSMCPCIMAKQLYETEVENDTAEIEDEEIDAVEDVHKVYIANTYIYKNGALRHSDKEFKTAVAAYKYLHTKMINYAGTTDATQTVEEYDGVTSTEIYRNDTSENHDETTTNAEIQKLIDAYDAELDARIAAKESNAEIIACIDDYVVDAELAAEVEIENAKAADIKEIKREIKYTHKNIFIRKMERAELEGGIETLKKLNRLCEKEFNARLQRKENLRDLVDIAEKIGDNLETIKRREERIAGIRRGIEIVEEELAELENRLAKVVTPVQEESPSVEEIFLKVADDLGIKGTDKGKYVFDIYDNDRCQHVCKKFKTLKDAVQISRIMHRELCKISRHIEASVEVLTMDINSLCMRADDWTLLYKIDNYGKEYVMRRETVEVIAELDKRTVEEVKKDVCIDAEDIDNLGVYRNSALESAEKKSLDWQSVSTKQKEFKKAYLQGNLQVATELFETLKIIYRAYVENRAA